MDDTFQEQSDDGHINTDDLLGTSEWRVWQARLIEENSYGLPIEPVEPAPPPIQYPSVPRQWEPLKQNLGLFIGSLLIGISVGLWLSEFEWVKGQ
jgi:hypothetical protein